jgi:Ca-activated chloride channel family protein
MRANSLFFTLMFAATACAGGSAYVVEPDDHPHPDDGGAVAVAPPEMPPHVFTPRAHTPKNRPAAVSPPDLATLPKLARSNQCSRSTRKGGGTRGGGYQPRPTPKPKPPVRPYKESQNKADNKPGATKAKDKKKRKKSKGGKKPASNTNRPYGDIPTAKQPGGGSIGGAADATGRDFAASTPSAPAAEAEAAPSYDLSPTAQSTSGERYRALDDDGGDSIATKSTSKLSRGDRREAKKNKRKRERAAKRRPAPVDTEAAGAAAPMPDYYEEDIAYEEEPYYPPDDPIEPVEPFEPNWPPEGQGWGDATFLSNDDTMSLSSAQRILYAIDGFVPLPLEHIRPHELLNYFSFEAAPVANGHDFSVKAELAPTPDDQGLHSLAISIQGRPIDYSNRRNAAITLVVDRSGSMKEEGRMNYLKRGLQRMVSELKTGDIVNLVTFDDRVCVPIQNFVVGRDDPKLLRKAITSIRPRGYTDVNSALNKAYSLADKTYQGTYSNRVLLVTDALANTGVTDSYTMSMVTDWYDARRIRLSGIGVGREFNDQLLDRLTERGRGAYVFLGSEAEVDAVFGSNFVSLIETTANDVHFRLHLPPSLRMYRFHGEEASTRQEDVQAIHYFANTSQLFLADLEAWEGNVRQQDYIMMEIEYGDPETGIELVEEYAFNIGDIAREGKNVKKARLVTRWVNALASIASRPLPNAWGPREHAWIDPYAWQTCEEERAQLTALSRGLNDAEVQRLLGLWDRYCLRYEQSKRPQRRDATQPAGWPGARG